MLGSLLGIDVGEQRVGLAIAHDGLSIAMPLTTLERRANDFWEQLLQVMKQNNIQGLVIGLPRGLEGQDTNQTEAVRQFAHELARQTSVPYHWQDEALTSVHAEEILRKQNKPYTKADIDAQAASLILTDYLDTRKIAQ